MPNRIRLYPWELASMDEYSSTMPTGTTLWKMWKRDRNNIPPRVYAVPHKSDYIVGQYQPHHREPDKLVRVVWFEVQLLEGPEPAVYHPPDWSNFARYKREAQEARDIERLTRGVG